MSKMLNDVDARTRLAGSNRLELLLFTLDDGRDGGKPEIFGINVFKVQEVIRTPEITRVPDPPPFVTGMASLRGEVVSAINLVEFCGKTSEGIPPTMIVTEFSRNVQAFLVRGVETIVRIDWSEVRQPPSVLSNSKITAITQLPDGRLVSILDVEQILCQVTGDTPAPSLESLEKQGVAIGDIKIICADDAAFARNQLKGTLDSLGVNSEFFVNGQEAWSRLDKIAALHVSNGERVADHVPIVITDLEMPEMDGFILTRKIKEDPRFDGVRVLIHSSMSGQSNIKRGQEMGADGFLAKFSSEEVASQISGLLRGLQKPVELLAA